MLLPHTCTRLLGAHASTVAIELPHLSASSVRELVWWAVEREQSFQLPEELYELAQLLLDRLPMRPRILEIGLGAGGTSWLWRKLWPEAQLVGIDVKLADCEACERRRAHTGCPRARIAATLDRFHLADSIDDAASLLAALPSGFDFVHIDGDHSYEGVSSDFDTYAPLAENAIALHDTLAYPGVRTFLSELRRIPGVGTIVEIGEEPRGYGYAVVLR